MNRRRLPFTAPLSDCSLTAHAPAHPATPGPGPLLPGELCPSEADRLLGALTVRYIERPWVTEEARAIIQACAERAARTD